MAYLILVATVSGCSDRVLLRGLLRQEVRSPWVVVFNLVFVGALFLVAESVGRKTESASELGPLGALGVGLAQVAALVPGEFRARGSPYYPPIRNSGARSLRVCWVGKGKEESDTG